MNYALLIGISIMVYLIMITGQLTTHKQTNDPSKISSFMPK